MTSWNSSFKKPGKQMKRSSIKRTKPAATGLTGVLSLPSAQRTKKGKGLRTRQRAVTVEEKVLWNRMAGEIGCIACLLDGHPNTYVSIHHIDGRTKPGCHKKVLPLCAGHHQDGTGEDKTMIAVHPWTARFEERYGTQEELLGRVMRVLGSLKEST
jgi:hypothetical protein